MGLLYSRRKKEGKKKKTHTQNLDFQQRPTRQNIYFSTVSLSWRRHIKGRRGFPIAVFEPFSGLMLALPNSLPTAHPVPATPTLEQKECMRGFRDCAITKAPPLRGLPRPWVKANKFLPLY